MRKLSFCLLFLLPILVYASIIDEWWLWEEKEPKPKAVKTKETQPGTIWKDPYLGMEFVWVSGGCYEMGDIFGGGGSDEKPVHEVCVNGFWMGKYEVTVGQYKKFLYETEYKILPNWVSTYNLSRPVVGVSWYDAKAFTKWLSKKSGYKFRLPTEVEWEYACRSGGRKVKFGTRTGNISHDLANYKGTSGRDSWEYTSPAGSFPPNPLGLYDMSGNVWEWCEDWYDDEYYSKSPKNNPKGPLSGTKRVLRGGSWAGDAWNCSCANRNRDYPVFTLDDVGFRLVRVGDGQ